MKERHPPEPRRVRLREDRVVLPNATNPSRIDRPCLDLLPPGRCGIVSASIPTHAAVAERRGGFALVVAASARLGAPSFRAFGSRRRNIWRRDAAAVQRRRGGEPSMHVSDDAFGQENTFPTLPRRTERESLNLTSRGEQVCSGPADVEVCFRTGEVDDGRELCRRRRNVRSTIVLHCAPLLPGHVPRVRCRKQ